MMTLLLMPNQKADALHRKRTWPRHDGYAYATIALLVLGQAYSLTLNIGAMFESTACLPLFGGQGCNATVTSLNATAC